MLNENLPAFAEAKVGTMAPDFNVKAFHLNEEKRIALSDYRGKWVVLFFYPADFTFVCPTELGDLADHYEELQRLNTEVLSVSVDTVWAHKVWHETSEIIQKVRFPMLSDTKREISTAYNVLNDEDGLAIRGRFIINPEGVLVGMEVLKNNVGRNTKELIRQIKAFQHTLEHGDVCPASWEPGKETLRDTLDLAGKL